MDCLKNRVYLSSIKYADFALRWVKDGATIIGGRCEINIKHINYIYKKLTSLGYEIS